MSADLGDHTCFTRVVDTWNANRLAMLAKLSVDEQRYFGVCRNVRMNDGDGPARCRWDDEEVKS